MKTALLALGALAATAVAFAADDDQVKKDLTALAGTWEYTSQVEDGQDTEKEKLAGITVTISSASAKT
jgi:hypothetical protein